MSARTYEKAKHVVATAKDRNASPEVREVAKEALAEMDATGKVDGAYRKVTEAAVERALDAEGIPDADAKRARLTLQPIEERVTVPGRLGHDTPHLVHLCIGLVN